MQVSVRVLGLDPGHTTGYFLAVGYEPAAWGSERDVHAIARAVGTADVVVFENGLDLDRVEPLRALLPVPWVGITPEQLQRRLFSRVLSRHRPQGPAARREVVRRAFGCTGLDAHALDAACAAAWWLAGSGVTARQGIAPDLGVLQVWDTFTIATEDGEETYQVVPPNTADPAAGLVSWASPLVQALRYARPGQSVRVAAPAGDWECTLVRIAERE